MASEQEQILKKLSPLLKIIKDRESLYFETLAFINKNIQSSFNDIDQIYIFNKFLTQIRHKQSELTLTETRFTNHFFVDPESKTESRKISSKSIDMIRHQARLLEELQMSVESVSSTIFGENGKMKDQFEKLKKQLNKIRQKGTISLVDFIKAFIEFSNAKYQKHIGRLQRYLSKLEVGEQINLRDFYQYNQKSDAELSPADKQSKIKQNQKKVRKKETEFDSPHKKTSVKKGSHRPKRTMKTMRRDQSVGSEKGKEEKGKQTTANMVLKLYNILQLNKKQFLEDYLFQKQGEEQQRKRIFNNLIQKNKNNGQQINYYIKKCQTYNPNLHVLYNPSSDENSIQQELQESKSSVKPHFIIKPRKPSWNFQSSNTDKSDAQAMIPQSKTIKNFSQKNRPTHSNTPKKRNASKKIMFVKPPLLFEGELIPKVEANKNKWIQDSLTGRNRSKRTEKLRIKNRNNPVPLENSRLPESFTFTQYPV